MGNFVIIGFMRKVIFYDNLSCSKTVIFSYSHLTLNVQTAQKLKMLAFFFTTSILNGVLQILLVKRLFSLLNNYTLMV